MYFYSGVDSMVPEVGAWAGFYANGTAQNSPQSMIGLRHVLHS